MTMRVSSPVPTRILVVEDNPMDVFLLEHAFKQEPEWSIEMSVAQDGQQAIDDLLQPGHSRPDLVILDLNLPKRSGSDVLRIIREADELRSLPVIIFSSSPEDLMRSTLGQTNASADCYMRKPLGYEDYVGLVGRFRDCFHHALKRYRG